MSNKTTLIPIKKKRESTPNFDAIGHDLKKLLGATAPTFVPKLADGLKEDWYPDISEKAIQDSEVTREGMIITILNEYSKEQTDDGVWKTSVIELFLPWYLKDPVHLKQWETRRNNVAKATKKYLSELEKAKADNKLAKFIDQLPEPPKESQKQTLEITDNSQIKAQIEEDPLFKKLGDTGQNAYDLYGKIFGPLQDLIEGLTHQRLIPMPDEDRFNEYIKPTREEFITIYHEVDKHMQVGLYNGFVYLKEILDDRIQLMDKTRPK